MIAFGYLAAMFIGISLGLIGGGGSILTLPVLVYLFRIPPVLATSYSLLIVGSTSLIGAYRSYNKNQVDLRTTFLFGLSSIATVLLTRKFILPLIPEQLFHIAGFQVTRSIVTMVLFAALMLLAARSMISEKKCSQKEADVLTYNRPYAKLLWYGAGIGLVTGLLGAGGGFLLIPALVMLVRLPMKKAVGTSLLIIALNSLAGFLSDVGSYTTDWLLLLIITGIAIAGITIGSILSQKIPGDRLKKGFGWFVMGMSIYIILTEVITI